MVSNLNLKDWLESLVALSILVGVPVTLMQRYVNSAIKDLRKELLYNIEKVTDLANAGIGAEVINRKESIRHSVDEALYCLDSQIENNSMKIEQLVSSLDYLKKEMAIKEQSVKDKYAGDLSYMLSLIDSIELYLESKNGYRRRKLNNVGLIKPDHSLSELD